MDGSIIIIIIASLSKLFKDIVLATKSSCLGLVVQPWHYLLSVAASSYTLHKICQCVTCDYLGAQELLYVPGFQY